MISKEEQRFLLDSAILLNAIKAKEDLNCTYETIFEREIPNSTDFLGTAISEATKLLITRLLEQAEFAEYNLQKKFKARHKVSFDEIEKESILFDDSHH